jgi:tRNA (guanine-N7-)-methyltransferase
MKPKDLKNPFPLEKNEPLLSNRVLFIPRDVEALKAWRFPGWSDASLFGNDNAISLEYCSGNGAWIADRALKYPQRNWVAVEKKLERVRKIWSKLQNLRLSNLFIICGEAQLFTQCCLSENSLSEVYINFPDPWPKRRHAANRLIQSDFIAELSRVMQRSSKAIFVTDDAPYSQQMIQEMLKSERWTPSFPEPFFVTQWPEYGSSYFEALWREKGRTINYLQFENQKP